MVVEILEAVGTRPGHIFNLGHGIHKTSDPGEGPHADPLRARALRAHPGRGVGLACRTGVLILGFGGPDSLDAVGPFMCNLMGREPSDELVVERVCGAT